MPKEITKVCLLVKSQSILFCRSVKHMYSKAAKPKKIVNDSYLNTHLTKGKCFGKEKQFKQIRL